MERVSTGVEGLDQILHGGLIANSAYLVRGMPGQGKTTLGLHFLCAGRDTDSCLFIGFQEPEEQIKANAAGVGLDVSHINFLSLTPDEQFFTQQQSYDVFSSADVEQRPLVESVVAAVEEHDPDRVFVDSLTQLRFLSGDIFQYRKQVLSFLKYLTARDATILFSSECSSSLPDDDLQFISDGVISLEAHDLGSAVKVQKFRGSDYYAGEHQMRNGSCGLEVFPRPMPPAFDRSETGFVQLGSGIPALDGMLGGGLETGTVSMITGPSGIGKSTLAACFAARAAEKERRAAIYLFEEEVATYTHRASNLAIDLNGQVTSGNLTIEQVEPMRYLADEFCMKVRQQVEECGLQLVIFDSTAGFQLTLEDEDIKVRLHALAKSLTRMGVSVLLVNETEGMTGRFQVSEKGISYLSDNVIFLRYMESDGELQRVLGILKKRLSDFDPRLHGYTIGPKALAMGDPVHGVEGVLTGTPTAQSGT